MKKREKARTLGTIPADANVCLTYYDNEGEILLESYAYEVGFFRFNWHPSLEIMLVIQGSLTLYIEHGIFDLAKDDLAVINPNEGHASMLQSPGTIAVVLHISHQYLEKLCPDASVPRFACHSSGESRDEPAFRLIRSCFSFIYQALSQDNTDSLLIPAQISMIMALLVRRFSSMPSSPKELKSSTQQRQTLHAMIKYINRHFRENITLQKMAEIFDMNPSYTSSYFKKHIGLGFHEYLIRKRLAYAIHMLNNTDDSILDIALDAGFPDAKALNLAFKKYFNISPNRYRIISESSADSSLKNLYPVRLAFTHPVVREKLSGYVSCPVSFDILL